MKREVIYGAVKTFPTTRIDMLECQSPCAIGKGLVVLQIHGPKNITTGGIDITVNAAELVEALKKFV